MLKLSSILLKIKKTVIWAFENTKTKPKVQQNSVDKLSVCVRGIGVTCAPQHAHTKLHGTHEHTWRLTLIRTGYARLFTR